MSTKSPVWPGSSLLVPIATDVLLVGQGDRSSATKWADLRNNYYQLWLKGHTAQPAPFSIRPDSDLYSTGAHIMWALPSGLRKGVQEDEDEAAVKFPLIPNRWLVTRFTYTTDGEAPALSPKIIQSNVLLELGDDDINKVNQYPHYEDTSLGIRVIGKSEDLEDFKGEKTDDVVLKAIGPGDISWSVSYDNVRNVLSLHDELPDEINTYSYSIIGWYSDPTQSPTQSLPTDSNTQWKAVLEENFNWTIEDLDEAIKDWLAWKKEFGLEGEWDPAKIQLPEQAKKMIEDWHNWQQANGKEAPSADLPVNCLLHSMIATVEWKGKNHSYGTGAPIGKNGKPAIPKLAVGNTPEAALAIFMAKETAEKDPHITEGDVPHLSKILEAFQRGLLFDLNDNPEWAERMLHDAQFDKKYAGKEWIVVRSESEPVDGESQGNRQGQQSTPLNEEQTKKLTSLNVSQENINDLYWAITTRRVELYCLAMKKEYLDYNQSSVGESDFETLSNKVNESIAAISSELESNKSKRQQLETSIKDKSNELAQLLGDDYELKDIDIDPVAAPADPVVMISGGEVDDKLSYLIHDPDNTSLPVRITGQTISAINVKFTKVYPDSINISWKDLIDKTKLPSWNAYPKEVQSLWLELLLLDTSNAELIAKLFFDKADLSPEHDQLPELTQKIKEQQTSCWPKVSAKPPTNALSAACGFDGTLPDPIGVAFRPDKNPWTPVYMDWRVKWIPTYSDIKDALSEWKLGSLDYEWVKKDLLTNGIRIQGRSIINLKTTRNLAERFNILETDANYKNLPEITYEQLNAVAKDIANLDFVAQSMGGFSEQLNTLLDVMKNEPTEENIASLLEGKTFFAPVPGPTDNQDKGPQFPIRAGHIQMIDLWLVDSFGQILSGKSNLLDDEPIQDVRWSERMKTTLDNEPDKAKTLGQLPPRITQDASMRVQFLQNNDDDIRTNSSDRTNPICGWLVPDHLDDALAVYESNGHIKGDVIKVRREMSNQIGNDLTIRWDSAPGLNTPLGAEPDLDNVHLQKMINALLTTGTSNSGALAYNELMGAIDASLWLSTDVQTDNNRSILMGTPLAVVRAEVTLKLAGTPYYDQSWYQTGAFYNDQGAYKPTFPPFASVDFYVRIGDSMMKNNGVMGYFANDDYTKFYSVYGINGQTSKLKELIRRERRGTDFNQLIDAIDTAPENHSGYVLTDHLVKLTAEGQPVKLTLIMDPAGDLPIVAGSLPGSFITLPNGPISKAMDNLSSSFRTGPLLLNPNNIKMPTPSEIKGDWSWIARKDVTQWQPDQPLTNETGQATLSTEPLSLIEGWLNLSNFTDDK